MDRHVAPHAAAQVQVLPVGVRAEAHVAVVVAAAAVAVIRGLFDERVSSKK